MSLHATLNGRKNKEQYRNDKFEVIEKQKKYSLSKCCAYASGSMKKIFENVYLLLLYKIIYQFKFSHLH